MEHVTHGAARTTERLPEAHDTLNNVPRTESAAPAGWLAGLLFAGFVLLGLAMQAFRISVAPDLFADEALYYIVGRNLAAGLGLTENGKVFLWHPPVYMLIEAAYLRIFGLVDADPVEAILRLRMINAVASALTAGMLFLIGKRLKGLLTGSTAALLFCLDPYVQRINRRNMLETVATLFLVFAVYLYLRQMRDGKHRLVATLPVGLALGLALLTKEILIFGLLMVWVFALLFRRDHLGRAGLITAVTALVYYLYPLWLILNGHGGAYTEMKARQVLRLFSRLFSDSPFLRGGPPVTAATISFWANLLNSLSQYFFSYLLILAGGATIVWLFIGNRTDEERLVWSWAASAYAVIGLGLLFGRISDQFFYYLIVPATLIVALALGALLARAGAAWSVLRAQRTAGAPLGPSQRLQRTIPLLVAPLLLVALLWNITVFIRLFMVGQDNSYAALYNYVNAHVPPGSTLVVGSDIPNYILPEYRIEFYRDRESVAENDVRYFILSTKERWGGYANVTPEFYDWVAANSHVRFEQDGNTFWDLRLFELTPDEPPT